MSDFCIRRDGSVTFEPFQGAGLPTTEHFGDNLLSAEQCSDGVVIRLRQPIGSYDKYGFDGTLIWVASIEALRIDVIENDRAVCVECKTRLMLPGRLRCLSFDGNQFYACVYPEGTMAGRNLFAYNTEGQLLWQIGERPWKPWAMLTNAAVWRHDGLLHAESGPNNLGVIVDRQTGAVVDRVDIR